MSAYRRIMQLVDSGKIFDDRFIIDGCIPRHNEYKDERTVDRLRLALLDEEVPDDMKTMIQERLHSMEMAHVS